MNNKVKNIVLTKEGKVSKNIINMINNCSFNFTDKKIYTGYYSGSGRFTSAHSALSTITSILDAAGYTYKIGNDAPKGGIKGEYVKVSKVAIEMIYNLK